LNIVLDTNVLISGMINPNGTSGRIIDLISAGKVNIVLDDRIFEEYCNVLNRPRFKHHFSDFEKTSIIEFLKLAGLRAKTSVVITDLPDMGDIPFLEIALSQDIPLVTGNLKHFPKSKTLNCTIITPNEFINQFHKLK
jgi:putative PIN family toxin of toxin-antitoxin system